jgi:hypothetical protein
MNNEGAKARSRTDSESKPGLFHKAGRVKPARGRCSAQLFLAQLRVFVVHCGFKDYSFGLLPLVRKLSLPRTVEH